MTASRPAPLHGVPLAVRPGVRLWCALVLCASLTGCAGGQLVQGREGAALPPQSLAIQAGMDPGETASATRSEAEVVAIPSPTSDDALAKRRFSHDRRELRAQIADVCRRFPGPGDPARLRQLVADLYASGVDPGAATESMRRARCAEPAEIVFEMVGQGGESSLEAVAAQFQGVRDPDPRRLIASALADGLARYAGEAAARSGEVAEQTPTYAMLYLPSVGESARLDSSIALNRLYVDAFPRFCLSPYALLGRGFPPDAHDEADR